MHFAHETPYLAMRRTQRQGAGEMRGMIGGGFLAQFAFDPSPLLANGIEGYLRGEAAGVSAKVHIAPACIACERCH